MKMKKTYIAPKQKFAELDMTGMIAESNGGLSALNDEEGYTEDEYAGGYTKQQKSLWDELW